MVANAQKGHATLKAGDQELTLAFTLNALCLIEDRLDCSISDLDERLKKAGARDMRVLLWAGLQEFHGEEVPDEEAAGALVAMSDAINAITTAMTAAFPDQGKPSGKPRAARGCR